MSRSCFVHLSQILDFKSPLKSLRAAWEAKTPKGKWQMIYDFGSFGSELSQINLFSTLKFGWLGYLTGAMIVLYYCMVCFTVYFYIAEGHFQSCMKSFCVFGAITTAFLAYITALTEARFTWKRLLNFSGEHLYRDDDEDSTYNRICSDHLNESVTSYVRVIILQTVSLSISMIAPAYGFLHGQRVTLFGVRLPFINRNPELEYIICACWESLVGIIALMGIWSIEILFVLINNTISVSSALCESELDELANDIENGRKCQNHGSQVLRAILMRTCYIDRFISDFNHIMYWRFFLAPPTLSFSIAMSIYCQYMMGHTAGYGLAVISYVQMVVICYTGQNVADRNQKLLEAFYNFKWYLLSTSDQKDVMLMILRMQNGIEFTIGPFQRLNYETLKNLSQRIYSLVMFIQRFDA